MKQTRTTNAAPAESRRRLTWVWLGMCMALLGALMLAVSGPSHAATDQAGSPPAPGGMHAGMHHGMGGGMAGGMMGGAMMGGSPEHVARMVDRMLDGLNATDAQRSEIKQIAQSAAVDLKAQREAGRALRERSLQIFTAPNVDATAAEALRQQMLAQHDQVSRRMTQAMLDISRVLTPEQRAKLGERVKDGAARMQDRMERMQRERPSR